MCESIKINPSYKGRDWDCASHAYLEARHSCVVNSFSGFFKLHLIAGNFSRILVVLLPELLDFANIVVVIQLQVVSRLTILLQFPKWHQLRVEAIKGYRQFLIECLPDRFVKLVLNVLKLSVAHIRVGA